MNTVETSEERRDWRLVIGGLGFFVAIGFLLFTEHRAHVIQGLPWLILLACLVLHLFMHGGRGHGGPHGHMKEASFQLTPQGEANDS